MDDFYDFLFENSAAQQNGASYFHTPESFSAPAAEPVQHVQPQPARKEKKQRRGLRIAALALACSLAGGAVGAGAVSLAGVGGNAAQQQIAVRAASREPVSVNVVSAERGEVLTPSQIYAANVNATVGITTEISSVNYFGQRTTGAASGSGFVISEDGYLLTNAHVIEDADSVTVTLYDGSSYAAEIVGSDADSDVAVLKIDAAGLQTVTLGDSDALQVGEAVYALGNPLGELTFSLTSGIVSALEREITMSDGNPMSLIQTDCAINAGNSGGALFNDRGEVVGITNAKLSAGMSETSIDNIGFAIPINRAMRIAQSILSDGSYEKPYLGVTVRPAEADEASGSPAGAEIVSVTDGSPAAAAGLQAGDIVTAANGKAVDSGTSLVLRVADCAAGEQLTLTVWRGGKLQDVTVTLAARPQDSAQSEPFRNH